MAWNFNYPVERHGAAWLIWKPGVRPFARKKTGILFWLSSTIGTTAGWIWSIYWVSTTGPPDPPLPRTLVEILLNQPDDGLYTARPAHNWHFAEIFFPLLTC